MADDNIAEVVGSAHDPQVVTLTLDEYNRLIAAGTIPVTQTPLEDAQDDVVNAQAAVENARGHLAGAEQSLADAQAALVALQGA